MRLRTGLVVIVSLVGVGRGFDGLTQTPTASRRVQKARTAAPTTPPVPPRAGKAETPLPQIRFTPSPTSTVRSVRRAVTSLPPPTVQVSVERPKQRTTSSRRCCDPTGFSTADLLGIALGIYAAALSTWLAIWKVTRAKPKLIIRARFDRPLAPQPVPVILSILIRNPRKVPIQVTMVAVTESVNKTPITTPRDSPTDRNPITLKEGGEFTRYWAPHRETTSVDSVFATDTTNRIWRAPRLRRQRYFRKWRKKVPLEAPPPAPPEQHENA